MVDKSVLTHIFECYQNSLEGSISRYSDAYGKTIENGLKFYDDFLKELIVDYSSQFSTNHTLGLIDNKIEDFFHTKELQFVAIDGTCSADPFKDFMVFFAAAYGVRGKISIKTDESDDEKKKKIIYERWSMEQDVSIVSYIPIPYAEAGDITDYGCEDFITDDNSKIDLSHIHNRLMELSEVYLAYNMANSSTLNGPKIILMDRSLSGLLMSTDGYISKVHLFGHPIGSRQLKFEDGLVIASHPINDELGIPSTKKFARWKYLVRELYLKKSIPLDELERKTGVTKSEWKVTLNENYTKKLVMYHDNIITRKFDFSSSWFDSVRFFEEFCDRLFHKREAEALIYKKTDDDKQISRWMSPEDIGFLTNIGIRALIEKCWERRILLIGLAKDSSTKFFTENYIGIMRNQGVFPDVKVGYLPWTDRTLLEGLSFNLDELNTPWATTEFDSVYMSLRLERVGKDVKIRGNRGEIVNQERVFARSLGQTGGSVLRSLPYYGGCTNYPKPEYLIR